MEGFFSVFLHHKDVDEENDLGRPGEWRNVDPTTKANGTYQLFLHFQGPTTILIQTRASRLSDVLSSQDVAEIADAPAGMVQSAVSSSTGAIAQGTKSAGIEPPKPLKVNFATVKPDGKVTFDKEASSTV